jgi:hypothetical protein
MRYSYLLILVIFEQAIYSQSFEYIKKLDTIYIPFKEGKFNKRIDYPEEKNGFKNRSYIFNLDEKNEKTFYFEFDRYSNKILEKKKVTIFSLNKIKKKVVKIQELKNFDFQEVACDLFNRLKIIYIIDLSKSNDSIRLYKVISMNACYAIE